MKQVIRGRVIKLGDNVNTDVIAPDLWRSQGHKVLQQHTLEAIRPHFCQLVKPGDILVAGSNFGCGSHREEATTIIQALGIVAICADSIARIYFRNGVAYGLPIVGIQGVSGIVEEGETIELVMSDDTTTITNLKTNLRISTSPLPETMMGILKEGGIFPLLKKELDKRTTVYHKVR